MSNIKGLQESYSWSSTVELTIWQFTPFKLCSGQNRTLLRSNIYHEKRYESNLLDFLVFYVLKRASLFFQRSSTSDLARNFIISYQQHFLLICKFHEEPQHP